MKLKNYFVSAGIVAASITVGASSALAACATDGLAASMEGPGGYPERALTMVVPYGPAGGSGQVAQAMAQAVTELTGVNINRDHKPGGSGTVGMTAFMATPNDGYTVMEHIDDASSAHALDSGRPNPAEDLIPLVTSAVDGLSPKSSTPTTSIASVIISLTLALYVTVPLVAIY